MVSFVHFMICTPILGASGMRVICDAQLTSISIGLYIMNAHTSNLLHCASSE